MHSFIKQISNILLDPGYICESKTKFRPQGSFHSSGGNSLLSNNNIIQVMIRSLKKNKVGCQDGE